MKKAQKILLIIINILALTGCIMMNYEFQNSNDIDYASSDYIFNTALFSFMMVLFFSCILFHFKTLPVYSKEIETNALENTFDIIDSNIITKRKIKISIFFWICDLIFIALLIITVSGVIVYSILEDTFESDLQNFRLLRSVTLMLVLAIWLSVDYYVLRKRYNGMKEK